MESAFACLKPVDSSMFSRAGYDDATWQLLLEFKSTREIRAYKNIAPEVADEMLTSESIGKWWNKNVKGNGTWEFETLGADPSVEPPQEKKQMPVVEGGITDDDIRTMEPRWDGEKIVPQTVSESAFKWPANSFAGKPVDAFTGEMAKPKQYDKVGYVNNPMPPFGPPSRVPSELSQLPMSDEDAFQTSGVKEFDPETGHWPADAVNEDGTVKEEALAAITKPEVLGAWKKPENVTEAVSLMQDHQSEIEALIRENQQFNADALNCRVGNVATHTGAGLVLSHLVAARDRTEGLLEPFRAIIYQSYLVAQDYKKKALEPLDAAIKHVKGQLTAWELEEDSKRQQKIREEQERAEAQARELQARQAEQMTLAEISDALEIGDTERAEQLVQTPLEVPKPYVPPAAVQPTYERPSGNSLRDNWKVDEESFDLVKFLTAVKDGKFPVDKAAQLIKPDIPALNKLAKALEKTFDVPGFLAKNEPVRSTRRGK